MRQLIKEQAIPITFTILTFGGLCLLLYGFIHGLNYLPTKEKIVFEIRVQDILVGLTIYLKTAIDFAIFIGNLMRSNQGWKNRIAIELGTAGGNALGTLLILLVWNFFREIPWLMAIMIFIASLVLLRMAEESIAELLHEPHDIPSFLTTQLRVLQRLLRIPNKTFSPLFRIISSNASFTLIGKMSWKRLLFFSATVPFILGLDDFAGYIPLFSIINVFGFAIGVFLGHMLLNVGLFLSPKRTVELVRNPFVLFVGGLAFVGIAMWGFYEVYHLLETMLSPQ